MSTTRPRLAAEERRADLIDCGCRVFSKGSYRGTTTAEIARESGVTEPILYRHFGSKRDLYLACLEEAWSRVQEAWEAVIAAEPDPAEWTAAMGRAFTELKEQKVMLHNLWVQSLAEASEDPEIRKYLRRHLRDVHTFVAGVIQRAQEGGHIPRDRDAEAEAWIFIAVGLLGALGQRLGLTEPDLQRIRTERLRWVTGRG
jgi:AcrR family transcriptional regulator